MQWLELTVDSDSRGIREFDSNTTEKMRKSLV